MADFFAQVKNRFYTLTLIKSVNEKVQIFRKEDSRDSKRE